MAHANPFASGPSTGAPAPALSVTTGNLRMRAAAVAPVRVRLTQGEPPPPPRPDSSTASAVDRATLANLLGARLQDLDQRMAMVVRDLSGAKPEQAATLRQRQAELERQQQDLRGALSQTDRLGQGLGGSQAFDETVRRLLGPAFNLLSHETAAPVPTGSVDRLA